MYCDSQSVLDHINKLQDPMNQSPRMTITNDYDVYATIVEALKCLQPVSVNFLHIKGHQDWLSKDKEKLSLPARLNIKCNKRAGKYLSGAWKLKPLPNPQLPQGFPHLTIDNQTIVHKIQENLQNAATTPDYCDYMQKKHDWSMADCQNVNWLSIWMAIQKFKLSDRTRLQKCLHDWLPLHAAKHMHQPGQ